MYRIICPKWGAPEHTYMGTLAHSHTTHTHTHTHAKPFLCTSDLSLVGTYKTYKTGKVFLIKKKKKTVVLTSKMVLFFVCFLSLVTVRNRFAQTKEWVVISLTLACSSLSRSVNA